LGVSVLRFWAVSFSVGICGWYSRNQISSEFVTYFLFLCTFLHSSYRGPDYVIPKKSSLDKYHEWLEYVMSLDSVKRTLPDKGESLMLSDVLHGDCWGPVCALVSIRLFLHSFLF
jgi:hypothetical protein